MQLCRRGVVLSVLCTARSLASPGDKEDALSALVGDSDADALSLLQTTRRVEQCDNSMPVQVFTDVDDTFKSSGGGHGNPAGCDAVYSKSVIYPGMAQFAVELARGPQERTRVLQPAVMSARPAEISALKVKDNDPLVIAMSATRQSDEDPADWDKYNVEMKLQVPPDLQSFSYEKSGIADVLGGTGSGDEIQLDLKGSRYGDLKNGVNDYEGMGETKYGHFVSFFSGAVDRSDDACVVWIGDDGQGDCSPGAFKMRRFKKPGRRQLGLKVAFIHRLECTGKPYCEDDPNPRSGDLAPVIMFDNYLEAAQIALKHGFISQSGFGRVKKAVESFNAVYCDKNGNSAAPETVSNLGCARLYQALKTEGPVATVPSLTFRAAKRFEAFCSGCCILGNNLIDQDHNGNYHFEFNGAQWRCHNLYHTYERFGSFSWSAWRIPMHATSEDCRKHCGRNTE